MNRLREEYKKLERTSEHRMHMLEMVYEDLYSRATEIFMTLDFYMKKVQERFPSNFFHIVERKRRLNNNIEKQAH